MCREEEPLVVVQPVGEMEQVGVSDHLDISEVKPPLAVVAAFVPASVASVERVIAASVAE